VFKSTFRDATSQVSRIFFMADFNDSSDFDEEFEDEEARFMDDEVVEDEDAPPKPFRGHFLFVENSIPKPSKVDQGSATKK
jgi:hypothetical protein